VSKRKALGEDPLGKRGVSKPQHMKSKGKGSGEDYYDWIEGMVGKRNIEKKTKPKHQKIVKPVRFAERSNKAKEKVAQRKKLVGTDTKDKEESNLGHPCKTATLTATGAGVGIIGAITTVTVAAAFKVALPVGLCLWAGGVTFGTIGLALGLSKKKKSAKKEE